MLEICHIDNIIGAGKIFIFTSDTGSTFTNKLEQ